MTVKSLGTVVDDGVVYVYGSDDAAAQGSILWRYRASDGTAYGSSPWLHATLPVWDAPSTMSFNSQIAIGKDKIGLLSLTASTANLVLTIITKSTGVVSSSTTIVNGANKGGADIAADGSDNFYVIWANTANTPNRVNKFNSAGVSQWSITAHTSLYGVYYDRINSRLLICGSAIDGGATDVAIISVADGTTTSSSAVAGADPWLSITGDGRGMYRLGAADIVVSINADYTINWTKTATGFTGYKLAAADGQQTTNVAKTTFRVHRLCGVLDGDVIGFDRRGEIAVASGLASLSAIAAVVFASQNGRYVYFADGVSTKRYDPVTNSMGTWTASAGSLPVSSGYYPRLIATWRGRTVQAGILADPHNWFMSKVNDPTDWDYGATVSAIMAVAGNQTNSTTGMPSDVITCLLPYSDNILFFGLDHTIARLDGDPMAGGQIQVVSDTVGMAWGRPFCRDPFGGIYFVSSRGPVYRMSPSGQLERISQAIDYKLDNIDLGQYVCRMAWDDRAQGAHVFLTPLNRDWETIHYWFDARNQSWWPDVFKDLDHNPKAVYLFDGDLPNDRKLLLGSWDGYIRNFEPTAKEDDGEAIESRVLIGPFAPKGQLPFILKDVQAVFGSDSDPVGYSLHVGSHAEEARAAAAAKVGMFLSGRSRSQFIRRGGHSAYLRLFNSTKGWAWAMESLLAVIAIENQTRRRIF